MSILFVDGVRIPEKRFEKEQNVLNNIQLTEALSHSEQICT